MRRSWTVLALAVTLAASGALRPLGAQSSADRPPQPRPWYERFGLRGYAQLRYNRLLETNPDLTCPACDRSIGNNNGFFLRRARLVVSGDPTDRTSMLVEVDYGTEIAGQQHTLQLRTAYFDVFLDQGRSHRARFGQVKLPFGFETLQSSSQRLALDRSDPINSGVPNERDLGLFYLWSPPTARARFRILADSGLKGSGDYGVLNTGVYNGQSANRPELNDNLHQIVRLAWPFRFANGQFLELGVSAYNGRFVIPGSQRTTGVTGPAEFTDRRTAVSAIFYPQPFGVQAEWNTGKGPEFDPVLNAIREQDLSGGYVQVMHRARVQGQSIIPFVRYQSYDGGKKLETDARHYRVRETEFGVEWTPARAVELTAQYTVSDRRYEDGVRPDNRQKGQLLRLQAQISY